MRAPVLVLTAAAGLVVGSFLLLRRQPEGVQASPLASGLSRALVVGDSHSEAAWTLGGRLRDALAAAGFVAEVEGNRGKGAVWYVTSGRLKARLASFKPDLLVVALGGNDAGQVEGAYKAKLGEFVQLARAAEVRQIVWFGPPRSEGALAARQPARQKIADWQEEVLPGLGVEWHDSMDLTADLPTVDGVHYASAKYATWASRAAPLVLDGVSVA